MKILYGINGTGNGHITKSMQVIKSLQSKGHEVDILISGMGKNIKLGFAPKYVFKGFTFLYKNGKIDLLKTILNSNIKRFIKDLNLKLNDYDKICTDFEPVTAWASNIRNVDSIGISHQYSFLDRKIPRPIKKSILQETFIKYFAPVTFPIGLHFERYSKDIFLPIIRDEILNSHPINNGHTTIYLPSYDLSHLINHFSKFSEKFEIFANVETNFKIKNISINPICNEKFTKSLITCDKIITGAGFETPSEALYLQKKIICIPIGGQYEQLCNSESLKKLGVVIEYDLPDLNIVNPKICKWDWENPLPHIIGRIEN